MQDEIIYHFNLPCTISLSDRPRSDSELRRRLAVALRQQLDAMDDDDTGSLITDIYDEQG